MPCPSACTGFPLPPPGSVRTPRLVLSARQSIQTGGHCPLRGVAHWRASLVAGIDVEHELLQIVLLVLSRTRLILAGPFFFVSVHPLDYSLNFFFGGSRLCPCLVLRGSSFLPWTSVALSLRGVKPPLRGSYFIKGSSAVCSRI
uniref:Uncharacterized protein n=1 Tax=Globodera pallida TaxID=36090 RepID=A0A183BRC5_GLOPA